MQVKSEMHDVGRKCSLSELVIYFARLGAVGFGGPIALTRRDGSATWSTRPGRSPTSTSTVVAGASSRSTTLLLHSLRRRKSWNRGRVPTISKFGMETATCSTLSVIRSPTITASRNSNSAGGIAAETPHDQGPPVIRSPLTGRCPTYGRQPANL